MLVSGYIDPMSRPVTPTLCSRYHEAVELIGRRWAGAIIYLLMNGRTRYAALREAIPGITDRMLSERLRELEEAGIVMRHVTPEIPVKVEYGLSKKGRELEKSIKSISDWASQWIDLPEMEPEPAPRTRRKTS
jgi:DNA-binding HxlR family transcriptional regulator